MKYAALLTLVFAVDDALMLHEEVMPAIGIPQYAIFIAYAFFGLMIVYGILRLGDRRKLNYFIASCGCLVASVIVDLLPHYVGYPRAVFEDVAKVLGIVLWAVYFIGVAARSLSAAREG